MGMYQVYWRREWLVGYSPWGHKEWDMTKQQSTHIRYINDILK